MNRRGYWWAILSFVGGAVIQQSVVEAGWRSLVVALGAGFMCGGMNVLSKYWERKGRA